MEASAEWMYSNLMQLAAEYKYQSVFTAVITHWAASGVALRGVRVILQSRIASLTDSSLHSDPLPASLTLSVFSLAERRLIREERRLESTWQLWESLRPDLGRSGWWRREARSLILEHNGHTALSQQSTVETDDAGGREAAGLIWDLKKRKRNEAEGVYDEDESDVSLRIKTWRKLSYSLWFHFECRENAAHSADLSVTDGARHLVQHDGLWHHSSHVCTAARLQRPRGALMLKPYAVPELWDDLLTLLETRRFIVLCLTWNANFLC